MIPPSDKELAANVRTAVALLNKAVEAAQHAGLSVSLESTPVYRYGLPDVDFYVATITRNTPL